MPRLTRTQKYATLRDELANDKEEKILTKDLSSYQNRLDNIQDNLSPAQNVAPAVETPVVNNTPVNPEYVWEPFKDDVAVEPVLPVVEEVIEPVAVEEPLHEEVIVDEPEVYEEIINEPVQADIIEQSQVEDIPVQEQPQIDEVVEDKSVKEPSNNETSTFELPAFERDDLDTLKDEGTYFNDFMSRPAQENKPQSDFNSYFEPEQKQSIDEVYANIFADAKDESGEIVSLKERDTYLNQTLSDVASYNINNGQSTIDQLVDRSVDEVRHPESKPIEEVKPIEVQPVEEFSWENLNKELDADKVDNILNSDDEEFSNTVSMEISKIMDEISNMPQEEIEPKFHGDTIQEAVANIDNEPTITSDVPVKEDAEDVVEIKNIAEMEAEPAKDTMSSTIPFIVAADDEEVLEEDEEDGSNTVLNVILIVLIVVLIAVLGLIVFYILKTKGIF